MLAAVSKRAASFATAAWALSSSKRSPMVRTEVADCFDNSSASLVIGVEEAAVGSQKLLDHQLPAEKAPLGPVRLLSFRDGRPGHPITLVVGRVALAFPTTRRRFIAPATAFAFGGLPSAAGPTAFLAFTEVAAAAEHGDEERSREGKSRYKNSSSLKWKQSKDNFLAGQTSGPSLVLRLCEEPAKTEGRRHPCALFA